MKIKKLKHFWIAIIAIIFFAVFWIFAPAPNWNLPSELIYRSLLPKYPNAKNIQNKWGCSFRFEVDKYELARVKSFYENSFFVKHFFEFQEGRSHSHSYPNPEEEYYYQDFSNYYFQRFNLTQRGLKVSGIVTTDGTYVSIECTLWTYF